MICKILYGINCILFLVSILSLIYKYYKFNYILILSPVFWFFLYYFAYFILPVVFIPTVLSRPDLFVNMTFSDETLEETYLLCFFISSFILLIFQLYTPHCIYGDIIYKRNVFVSSLEELILIVFALTSLIACLKLIQLIKEAGYLQSFFQLDRLGDIYRAKFKFTTFRYFAVVCAYYKFYEKKKYTTFLYLLPNLVFEILAGKRTTAFLYIIIIYLVFVKEKKKSYAKIIVPIFILLLVSVLFSRMASIYQSDVGVDIIIASSLGEFINTFLTLPYVLEHNLDAQIGVVQNLYNLFSPLLPGFIRSNITASMNFYEVGSLLADAIHLGFGLGANVISYNIVSFGIQGVLVVPLTLLVVLGMEKFLLKDCNFILNFFLIYQLRLFMRQGNENFIILIYCFFFYCGIFYFSSDRKSQLLFKIQSKRGKLIGKN